MARVGFVKMAILCDRHKFSCAGRGRQICPLAAEWRAAL